jgi:alginate O-acetyltransferase complex protein AlgI
VFSLLNFDVLTIEHIILPVGISFVVFQKVTYCLDIAKGIAEPAKKFYQYIEYLLIFPQIIAGPIVKYNTFIPQITQRTITLVGIQNGFGRFSLGLFKKVWIADVVAKYADVAFIGPSNVIPIHYTWVGVICYTLQIYFDFSGYSDMAIGMLKIMGFEIPENFNHPYISRSITEFWKRWHISLTSWMREYLYIPLGGNRKGDARTFFNQWIVFLISGFWHGASWNFIFWGIYHGTLLCVEKAIGLKRMQKIPSPIRIGTTMMLVMIGWVFFRSDGFKNSLSYLKQMFNIFSINIHTDPNRIMVINNHGKFTILFACLICILPVFDRLRNLLSYLMKTHEKITFFIMFSLFCLSVIKVGTAFISPFIYFRF